MPYPVIKVTGDTSLAVIFGDEISNAMNDKVRAFDEALAEAKISGVYETVPTYCAVTVHYAPETIRFGELKDRLDLIIKNMKNASTGSVSVIELPVLYGGEYGPDLSYVAKYNHMTQEDVIRIHTAPDYLIYMLGFTPGFPYLGGMDPMIATPRLKAPREVIPAGSVGIAGKQTGVYPMETPGGWQLIGRTPVSLYDPKRERPILLDAGMHVRFKAVDIMTYESIESQVRSGTYKPRIYREEN